ARITDLVLKHKPSYSIGDEIDYEAKRRANASRRDLPIPRGLKLEELDLNGMAGEKLTKEGNDKGWILYIHGGGCTSGTARERRVITQYLVDRCGYNCLAINYRLAPENLWPAQIDDCFSAYANALKQGYRAEEIVLMGESAGGTLALATALKARDEGLPKPMAVVAFSPATDNYEALPSHTANIASDYMLTDAVAKGIAQVMFDHDPTKEELTQPLLSPLYGDYRGLPPIHLSASDSEVLYDDAALLYDKLRKEGHEAVMETAHQVCHAYQIMTYMPESRKTIKNVMRFLDDIRERK
ncbi:MAG: alpha/beta hydrolase, partial [Erysipelotrichaceae bacterium]|nr:alpha/beta hydrolase [Erysipelotrichaceae bacterium]